MNKYKTVKNSRTKAEMIALSGEPAAFTLQEMPFFQMRYVSNLEGRKMPGKVFLLDQF